MMILFFSWLSWIWWLRIFRPSPLPEGGRRRSEPPYCGPAKTSAGSSLADSASTASASARKAANSWLD